MGLLDLFGGGDSGGGAASLYGDALNPQQRQALAERGLLGFLGGMQKSGALDYTAPFLSGKVPGSFAAGLAGGAGGMGEAEDAGATNAMRARLLGLQGQQLQFHMKMIPTLLDAAQRYLGQPGAPGAPASGSPAAMPGAAPGAMPPAGPATAGGNGSDWELAHNNFAGMRVPGVPAAGGPLSNPAGWQQFATPEDGIGAISHQLDRYASGATTGKPLTTLRQIVSTWAPASENPTSQLIARASQVTGFAPDQPLDMSDPAVKAKLIEATIRNEQGGKLPVDPAMIQKVAALRNPSALTVGGGLLNMPGNASPAPTGGLLSPAASGGAPGPSAAPAAAGGGLDPRGAVSLGLAGSMLGFPGLGQLLTGTPDYKAAVAQAVKKAELPLTPGTARAGSALTMGGQITGFVPQIQKTIDPATGQESFAYMSPGGTQPTGQVAGLGPGQQAALKKTAEAQVQYNPLATTPAQGAGGEKQAPIPGTTLAPGLTSTVPEIKEPQLSPEDYKHNVPKWADMNAEMTASIGQSQQAEHRLQNIAAAFKMVDTGAMLTQRAEFDALMKTLGIPTSLSGDPAKVELALHENYRATLQNLGAVNKRFTQNEFKVVSEQSEHPNLQPAANLEMLSEDIGTLRQGRALASDWLNAQLQGGARNPEAFQTRWMQANPLDKIVGAVRQEIGPLKGMPGTPTQAAAPKEGDIAYGPGGHRIQMHNGGWVDLSTLKPFVPAAPASR